MRALNVFIVQLGENSCAFNNSMLAVDALEIPRVELPQVGTYSYSRENEMKLNYCANSINTRIQRCDVKFVNVNELPTNEEIKKKPS